MASRAEEFAKLYLPNEIKAIETSERAGGAKELDTFEKAIIYKYSTDGYISLNEQLRESNGEKITELGLLLEEVLKKLPNYRGLVFRRAQVSQEQIKKYKRAFRENATISEICFMSTSKIKTYALLYAGNVVFRISSKTGKDIEKIAKFGVFEGPNEFEVLFNRNTNFHILGITKEHDYTLITLEEE
jgi:hypothetical protein